MRSRYGLDETREPWCFLSLNVGDSGGRGSLNSWAIGDGNAGQLTSTEIQDSQSGGRSTDLILGLAEELDARRYEDRTLVTTDEATIANLRRILLICPLVESPTLRGFTHLALNNVFDQYFGGHIPTEILHREENTSSRGRAGHTLGGHGTSITGLESLWEAWTTVYQLIPVSACLGESL
jgi:hypothetical protein